MLTLWYITTKFPATFNTEDGAQNLQTKPKSHPHMSTLKFTVKLDESTARAFLNEVNSSDGSDITLKIIDSNLSNTKTTGFHSSQWVDILIEAAFKGSVAGVVAGSLHFGAEMATKSILSKIKSASEKSGTSTGYQISGDSVDIKGSIDSIEE
ncbi:MAG: hypothetical protein QM758_14570 [Armatimonas sp.]